MTPPASFGGLRRPLATAFISFRKHHDSLPFLHDSSHASSKTIEGLRIFYANETDTAPCPLRFGVVRTTISISRPRSVRQSINFRSEKPRN
jgi:hypothetical protein